MSGVDATERDRLVALLEANHRFPGPFFLAVIAVNEDDVGVAIRAAVQDGVDTVVADDAWEVRASSAGRFLSHRVTVAVDSAADVLGLYDRLRRVRGVVAVL